MASLKMSSIFALILSFPVFAHGDTNVGKTPIIYMRTCELVKQYNYPCETHKVTTKDGYILEMHRIPYGKAKTTNSTTRPVAFLQHGIMDSSAGWVINPPNQSLGFLLADRGYDVWMGNSRGNTYSEKHIFLDPSEQRFWDYSFEEMAKYDLPAEIDYVIKQTNMDQVTYIGHSQGTTQAFVAFSRNKRLASKIKLFIALAPVAYLNHAKGLLRFLSNHNFLTNVILKFLGTKQFLPNCFVLKLLAKYICGKLVRKSLCGVPIFLIVGYDTGNIDLERIPVYMTHVPAGTSMKSLNHFSQLIQSGKFAMFDYGWNGNIKHYKQPTPPNYNVENMQVPVALFGGEFDWLSTPIDVNLGLQHSLPNMRFFHYEVNWNHMDFMWAKNAKEKIYDKIFDLMDGNVPRNTTSF